MSPVSLYSCNITLSVVSVLGGGCEIGERDNLSVAIKMLGEKTVQTYTIPLVAH